MSYISGVHCDRTFKHFNNLKLKDETRWESSEGLFTIERKVSKEKKREGAKELLLSLFSCVLVSPAVCDYFIGKSCDLKRSVTVLHAPVCLCVCVSGRSHFVHTGRMFVFKCQMGKSCVIVDIYFS